MVSPRIAYGIWIDGQGWLKRDGSAPIEQRTFATTSQIMAERVAAFWGAGATVLPIDESLIDLELVLLEHRKPKPWGEWIKRFKVSRGLL